MTEIIIYSKFGSKVCRPFEINRVQDNSDEEEQINSESGEVLAQDQDEQAPENIADD